MNSPSGCVPCRVVRQRSCRIPLLSGSLLGWNLGEDAESKGVDIDLFLRYSTRAYLVFESKSNFRVSDVLVRVGSKREHLSETE
jgi:hypothetical protein